ncbi:SCO3242 family prenyltransferase [Phycicoccus flavus]|uniref:SCO3242 family prenyltransferase n=1 Tax=Phycicoccus flavus TaxID=2502783 RepID=UPI000FEB9773|nr:UbiA family prenyltransferase [Phycicoccus flavus]NHA67856.1 UbiA family prenyltransferase [Phycicoccus flavus]
MTLADLAELVRAPAALTVPGDSLAGGAAAGWPGGARSAVLPLASVSLYWAGMALNDWADRDLDALERPERPIPSGRVRPRTALGLAAALSAAGVGLAAAGGGPRAAALATVLAGAVWAYDLSPKSGPVSTAVMASTRGLDVLLGAAAGGRAGLRAAAGPAALLTLHTAGVTALSRGEVRGTSALVARGALATTGAVAAATPFLALAPNGSGLPRTVRAAVATVGTGLYAAAVGRAQARAVEEPTAATARAATVSGIRGMVPLQTALLGAAGAPRVAAGLAALTWSARSLTRRGTPT